METQRYACHFCLLFSLLIIGGLICSVFQWFLTTPMEVTNEKGKKERLIMKCPMCHRLIPEDSRFCPFCGSSTSQPEAVQHQTSKPEQGDKDFAALVKDAGQQLIRNVDFHHLKITGIVTLTVIGWVIEFAGFFMGVVQYGGRSATLQNISDFFQLPSGWILLGAIVLIILGLYSALNPNHPRADQINTVYGIASMINSFPIVLIMLILQGMAGSLSSSITFIGWIYLLVAVAILVLSQMGLKWLYFQSEAVPVKKGKR